MAVYYATNEITGSTTAAALTGAQTIRRPAVVTDGAGEVVWTKGTISFASGVNPIINDVIELCILPADHVPVDWILLGDQFDSSTGASVQIGVMAGTPGDASRVYTDVGSEAFANAALLRSAALTRCSALTWARLAPSSTADRSIGLTFVAAPTTSPSTTRVINFMMSYRWSRYGA